MLGGEIHAYTIHYAYIHMHAGYSTYRWETTSHLP